MPKSKLSKASIEALPFAKPGGSYYQMDSEVPGFGIRVYPTRKVYIVRYRGKPYEIGDVRLVKSLDEARSDARRRKMRLEQGEGPAIASLFLEEARRLLAPDLFEAVMGAAQERFVAAGGVVSEIQRVTRRTLGELAEKMKAHYREHRVRAAGVKYDCNRWDRIIVPALGGPSRALRDISQEDIERMITPYRDRPTEANRLVNLLHWGLRKVSLTRPPWLLPHEIPTTSIERHPSHPRKRPFSEEELPRLWGALIACRRLHRFSPIALDACELILLTGCRPGEPLAATASWIEILADGSAGIIRVPAAKGDRSGRERGRSIYLGAEGVAIIQRRLRAMKANNIHIFPGRIGSHITYNSVWRMFRELFRLAGVEDRVPYSARHTYVSEGEDAGVILTDMKDLAGHRSVTTTDHHYRSAKTRRLMAAAQQMSQHLAGYAAAGESAAREIAERLAATAGTEGFVSLPEESHPRES